MSYANRFIDSISVEVVFTEATAAFAAAAVKFW